MNRLERSNIHMLRPDVTAPARYVRVADAKALALAFLDKIAKLSDESVARVANKGVPDAAAAAAELRTHYDEILAKVRSNIDELCA